MAMPKRGRRGRRRGALEEDGSVTCEAHALLCKSVGTRRTTQNMFSRVSGSASAPANQPVGRKSQRKK